MTKPPLEDATALGGAPAVDAGEVAAVAALALDAVAKAAARRGLMMELGEEVLLVAGLADVATAVADAGLAGACTGDFALEEVSLAAAGAGGVNGLTLALLAMVE